jgi:hypothetical protein
MAIRVSTNMEEKIMNGLKVFGVFICFLMFVLMTSTVSAGLPPIAHWTLDEAEGDTAHDMIGNRHGVWVGGAPQWLPEGGFYGGAILFKNNKFFLERNNSSSSGTVNGIHFKAKDETGSIQPFNLYGNITIDDGWWHHIVGIYNADIAQLYIDGVLDVEGPADGNLIGIIPDPLVIGAKFEDNYRNTWNGLIDDVKLFNYAMSEVEVDSLFNIETKVKPKYRNGRVTTMQLHQNYPNPFNASTKIRFDLSKPSTVVLKIYDVIGREIETLADGFYNMGEYELDWVTTDLPSGVYLYTLETETFKETKKLVLQK